MQVGEFTYRVNCDGVEREYHCSFDVFYHFANDGDDEYLIGSARGRIRGISGLDYVRGRLDSSYCHGPTAICDPALDRVMADEMHRPF